MELGQLGQAQAENKQVKKFVKKYVPFKKRKNQDQKQSTKQQKHAPHTKTDDDKGPKVNKIEVHNESDDDEEYLLWNLYMETQNLRNTTVTMRFLVHKYMLF